MNDPITDWRNRRASMQAANKKLVQKLRKKKKKPLNELGDQLHEEVFEQVDCLQCANCCTSIPPIVNKTDAARIAKHLGMKVAEFEEEYLTQDEDGDRVMNTSPCRFLLENNHCMIYEYRPKACRQYPHTDNFEFGERLRLHAVNAFYCPGVFHILERIRQIGL